MSFHRIFFLVSVFALATLSSYGCDDDNGRSDRRVDRLAPSPISFIPSAGRVLSSADLFSLQRDIVPPIRNTSAMACPARSPFVARFNILGKGDGRSDIFMREVQMGFVDRAGVSGGFTTITQRELDERFGSTRITSVGRSFPFEFPLGCIGQPVGTLTAVVFSLDSSGREFRTPLTMSVR